MIPAIIAAIQLAQNKAKNENERIDSLQTNPYAVQPTSNIQQPTNNLGNAVGSIASIFGKKKEEGQV